MRMLLGGLIALGLVLCATGPAMAECTCQNCSADPVFVQRDLRTIETLKLLRKYRDSKPDDVTIVRMGRTSVVAEPARRPDPRPVRDDKVGSKQLRRLRHVLQTLRSR